MLRNVLMLFFIWTLSVHAGEKKVSTISCDLAQIYKCTIEKCEKFKVVNIDGVQYIEINTEKQTLTGKIGNTVVDIENIISRHGNENTFVFFGTHADSKFDWALRIDRKSKKMVLLATNVDLDGFTVYGTCKWEMQK